VSILSVLKTVYQVTTLVVGLIDQFAREKRREQAEKAKARKKQSDIYREASNNAGPKAK
jgi:heme exporter protein D